MSITNNLGRVGFVLRGEYDANANYTRLDVVTHEHCSYAATKDVSGIAPPDPAWQPLADISGALAAVDAAVQRADEAIENVNAKADEAVELANTAVETANTANRAAADAIASLAANAHAGAIVPEATGETIAINDSSESPFAGMRIFGKTMQDGTPTPETPVDLVNAGNAGSIGVSVCGKNLIDVSQWQSTTKDGIEYTISEGVIKAVGTNTLDYVSNTNATKIAAKAGETYTLSGTPVSNKCYIVCGYKDADNITKYLNGNGTFTVGMDCAISIRIQSAASATVDCSFAPMLEKGSAATEYEAPKTVQTLALSTPNGLPGIPVIESGNYTDETGQEWVCDEIDLGRGVYIQRVKQIVFDGTETWLKLTDNNGYYAGSTDNPKLNGILTQTEGLAAHRIALNTHYKGSTDSNTTGVEDNTVAQYMGTRGRTLRFIDYEVSTLEEWVAFVADEYAKGTPLTSVCCLVTPIETPLDESTIAAFAALHTNKPNTTVFNDAGAGQKVEYIADTKIYIDNKFSELAAAIAALEG